jgi:hypothetical protein
LAERGHKRVALAVDVTNMRARTLYERLGYRLWQHPSVPHVRCYDPFDDSGGPPEICHVMVKDLR